MENNIQEYTEPKPGMIPQPTYWPFMLAVSLAFLGWGLLTSAILLFAGLAGMAISITGWIKEMLHERTDESGEPEELSH